jgi:glycosyltransferase involved in cell wall biosynthesis
MSPLELSIVLPCLNEARTLARCIGKAKGFLERSGVHGEIIVADNGSTDGSREIAEKAGARVIEVSRPGYGSALRGGIDAAKGTYIVMGDADDSYDFSDLMPFVAALRAGSDLVMGNRFRGGIRPGAMPWLHRYVGNPVLTAIGNLFFRSPIHDFHCGLRAFRAEAIRSLQLRTTGMEFATEMVVRAILHGLKITEVPTVLRPDGRDRKPHLRTWRDGWRHLRFLLLYSPRWLFLYPGILFILLGTFFGLLLLPGQRGVFDIHTLFYCGALVVLGVNALSFALFAKAFAMTTRLVPPTPLMGRLYGKHSLEAGVIIGALILAVGIGLSVYAFLLWRNRGYSNLDPQAMFRLVIPSVTLIFVGVQIVFSSFFLSILQIPRDEGQG